MTTANGPYFNDRDWFAALKRTGANRATHGLVGAKFTKPAWKGQLSTELVDLGDGITGQEWCTNTHGATVFACSDGKFRYYRDGRPAGEWPGLKADASEALQRIANAG